MLVQKLISIAAVIASTTAQATTPTSSAPTGPDDFLEITMAAEVRTHAPSSRARVLLANYPCH